MDKPFEESRDRDDPRVLPFPRSTRSRTSEPGFEPAVGPPARDRYYAERLRQLARLDLEESQARAVWRAAVEHRGALARQLRRDVGLRVALYDYLANIRSHLREPNIIERAGPDDIEHPVIIDSLTGLYNRHYFHSAFGLDMERCRHFGVCPSLLLMDVDHFEGVSERLGHDLADRMLRRVGAVIQQLVRADDIPCRFGGDQFAIILPDSESADARTVGERIRARLHTAFAAIPRSDPCPPTLTISRGVASATPRSVTAEQVFHEAERALSHAKRAGLNRHARRRAQSPR